MLITTGIGKVKSRFRNAEPSSHASFVVKCSKTNEASIREIDSSYKLWVSFISEILDFNTRLWEVSVWALDSLASSCPTY